MNKILLTAAIVVVPLFSTMPAFAMKGVDAARSCEAQPGRCKALFDDAGGVTILVDGYMIDCPSPQEDCNVVGRPTRTKGPALPFNPAAIGGGATIAR